MLISDCWPLICWYLNLDYVGLYTQLVVTSSAPLYWLWASKTTLFFTKCIWSTDFVQFVTDIGSRWTMCWCHSIFNFCRFGSFATTRSHFQRPNDNCNDSDEAQANMFLQFRKIPHFHGDVRLWRDFFVLNRYFRWADIHQWIESVLVWQPSRSRSCKLEKSDGSPIRAMLKVQQYFQWVLWQNAPTRHPPGVSSYLQIGRGLLYHKLCICENGTNRA